MTEPGFLPAYENDPDGTADQLVFIDHALQVFIAYKLRDLPC